MTKKYDDRRAGTVIAEKYQVDKLIAKGGFSSVYRGVQLGMGRPIAIKVLEMSGDIKSSWLKRFEREAKLVSQLRNPNTITIYDFGREEDFLYIVMEYIRGRSLSRQLKKFGALGVDDTALIMIGILKSLDEAHKFSVLHRDMKPSNVMLGRDHNEELIVRVLDFGVAKELAPDTDQAVLTMAGSFLGTPRYAAPEQLRREELTPAADLYGAGMVMWECLTGKPPVPTTDFSTCVEYHLGPDPWRLPDSILCPRSLANILYKALEKKIENRYATAAEMLADLEEWAAAESSHQHDDTFIEAPRSELGTPDTSGGLDVVESSFEAMSEFDPNHLYDPTALVPEPQFQSLRSFDPQTDTDDRFNPVNDISPANDVLSPVDEVIPLMKPRVDYERPRPQPRGKTKPKKNLTNLVALFVGAFVLFGTGAGIAVVLMGDAPAKTQDVLDIALPSSTVTNKVVYPAGAIILAMKTASWMVDDPEVSDLGDVVRYTAFAMKNGKVAHITIYECKDWAMAEALIEDTEPPAESVVFGQTVVRLTPGPSSDRNGVKSLTGMLFTFKTMLHNNGDL